MKFLLIVMLVLLVVVFWRHFKTRVGRAVRLAATAYMAAIAIGLVGSGIDRNQLEVAGISLALFAGIWAVAWLATRFAAGNR